MQRGANIYKLNIVKAIRHPPVQNQHFNFRASLTKYIMYAVAPTLNQKMSRLKMGSRKNCCESKKIFFQKIPYPKQCSILRTSLTEHSPKLLNQSEKFKCYEENRNCSETAEKENKCLSNIYLSKISTSTSGYL